MDATSAAPPDRLQLLDWRRRVHEHYAEGRALWPKDTAAAHAHWRAGRDHLFRHHPQSPIRPSDRSAFGGLAVAPYDPAYAFLVPVQSLEIERLEVPTSTGGTTAFERFGAVDLPVGALEVFWLDAYGGGLFLPFRDATNGEQTYGGGRYVLDTVKGADLGPDGEEGPAQLLVDFNFAYNPSCHYDSDWTCPLAPPGNWLDAAVPVGEQVWQA
jgi:uncharacterized protein